MTVPLFIRRYRPEDREACLELFASNMPTFFIEPERVMFTEFLEKLPGPYLAIEDSPGRLVACGGLAFRDTGDASLCWGLVDFHRHKEGIGRVLMRVRLALACQVPGVSRVWMKTSDGNVPFFAREGFRFSGAVEGYFRPSQLLLCELDAPRRAELGSMVSSLLAQGHRLEDGLLPALPMIPWSYG